MAESLFRWSTPPLLPEVKMGSRRGWYTVPSGDEYPAITTVIGWQSDQSGDLKQWRDRVGAEEAERIGKEAGDRGKAIHRAIEDLLNGRTPEFAQDEHRQTFRRLLPELACVDDIVGLELVMYSDELRLMGRCDCIASFEGEPCVVDFKTSARPKRAEWVQSHILQATAYAVMYSELTGQAITKGMVLVASPNTVQRFAVNVPRERRNLEALLARFYSSPEVAVV